MEAIDIGSMWGFVNDDVSFEVTNMYVDEDGETQLSIDYQNVEKTLSVHADDLRNLMRVDELERVDDGHEAWKARQ